MIICKSCLSFDKIKNMAEEQITIETPEHIYIHYELAGIGSRALAGLVDLFLQGVGTLLVVVSLLWLGQKFKLQDTLGIVSAIIVASSGFLAFTVYYILAEMLTDGRSPGKRMAGLRVLSVDGRPLSFLQSALRNILRAVDILPFLYSVGLLAIFFSPRCQRLGDIAAGTIVVKERLYGPPPTVAHTAETPPALPLPGDVQARLRSSLHVLSTAEISTAEHFLARRYELSAEIRRELARKIAEPLLEKLPYVQPDDFPDLEIFLQALVQLAKPKNF